VAPTLFCLPTQITVAAYGSLLSLSITLKAIQFNTFLIVGYNDVIITHRSQEAIRDEVGPPTLNNQPQHLSLLAVSNVGSGSGQRH